MMNDYKEDLLNDLDELGKMNQLFVIEILLQLMVQKQQRCLEKNVLNYLKMKQYKNWL